MREKLLALYESGFLIAQAMRLTQDTDKANDLVQDTFIKVIDNQDKYSQGKSSLECYVTVVMRNIYLNEIRHQKIKTRNLEVYAEKYEMTSRDITDYVYCQQLISRSQHKNILKLLAVGYRIKEIAEMLGINPNTTFSKVRYMKLDLAKFKD